MEHSLQRQENMTDSKLHLYSENREYKVTQVWQPVSHWGYVSGFNSVKIERDRIKYLSCYMCVQGVTVTQMAETSTDPRGVSRTEAESECELWVLVQERFLGYVNAKPCA